MAARIRTPDAAEGVAFHCDAEFLAGIELLNLTTVFGDLDIAFEPAGTKGYADLEASCIRIDVDGVKLPVAALEDVIRSKSAANRPKDQRALPVLHQLLAEIRRLPRS